MSAFQHLDILSGGREINVRFRRKDDQVTIDIWTVGNVFTIPLTQTQRDEIRVLLAQADLAKYQEQELATQ